MAQDTCTITVTDYTGHREDGSSDVIQITGVSVELTMFEVKELICGQKNNAAITAANTVLYMGKNVLEDKKQLKVYNRSRRTNLALELHDLVLLNITVKTLQHCGRGRCVMVPLWAFCCRQTISLKLPDYETVGVLRKEVANELGDPVKNSAVGAQSTGGDTSSKGAAVPTSPRGAAVGGEAAQELPPTSEDHPEAAPETPAPAPEAGGGEDEGHKEAEGHDEAAAEAPAEHAET